MAVKSCLTRIISSGTHQPVASELFTPTHCPVASELFTPPSSRFLRAGKIGRSRAAAVERATRSPSMERASRAAAVERARASRSPAMERASRPPAMERATRAPAMERTTRAAVRVQRRQSESTKRAARQRVRWLSQARAWREDGGWGGAGTRSNGRPAARFVHRAPAMGGRYRISVQLVLKQAWKRHGYYGSKGFPLGGNIAAGDESSSGGSSWSSSPASSPASSTLDFEVALSLEELRNSLRDEIELEESGASEESATEP